MEQQPSDASNVSTGTWAWPAATAALEYTIDAWQRSILALDVLRERGNQHFAEAERKAPNVLSFEFEVILDGRTFDRPVNYALARIIPPAGTVIDPRKRPFIIFDPRAGQEPGIGGMKHDSEIGVALQAGHSCYFVGFLPDPVPGQGIEDVCRAGARFIEAVTARHPEAQGKPCLIGNCQAGWQTMMTAAMQPELPGPIILAGAPLSYWAGAKGQRSLRYVGGLLGGSWLTTLCGDLGNGIFDGANLVANFEMLHPSNTYWKKPYDLYSRVDTEAARFLAFERWWGSPVKLNAKEMQFITDQLFVGNKLSTGQVLTSDGLRLDLRNVTSPIIVFCSHGDDITPPQQALDWILDLYENEKDVAEAGQTIIYCVHQTIGHLGIFVSGKVATKEHEEFALALDMIDLMPPGLYEAVITNVGPDTANPNLVHGPYLFTLEARTLGDIRAMGVNDAADDMRFVTVARLSEINQGLYVTAVQPLVRQMVTDQSAEWLRRMHPHRVRFEIFSDQNPLMRWLPDLAAVARDYRQPVAQDNPFLAAEHQVSDWIIQAYDRAAEWRDAWQEAVFINVYGSPVLQAVLGLRGEHAVSAHHAERDWAREAGKQRAVAALEAHLTSGGAVAAAARAMLFIIWPGRRIDERAFSMLQMIAGEMPAEYRVGPARFKEILRAQALVLMTDEARAIAALPAMLPHNGKARELVFDAVRRVVGSGAPLSPISLARLAQVKALLSNEEEPPAAAARLPAVATVKRVEVAE
jgi:hypothetical protein